ncbi:MAG TPA: hypothetical protein VNK26_02865, partial [Pyrinomonadaceae bacterium]|nr:hypothetical protein [Pyrinomonadaceae bacterium]
MAAHSSYLRNILSAAALILLLALTAVGQGAHRLANGHLKIGISSLLYKKLDYIPKHEIDNAIYQA